MTSKTENRVTTSHWGAFRVLTDDNRIVGTEAFAPDPHPSATARRRASQKPGRKAVDSTRLAAGR
jgi:hypothetical protein